MPKLFASKALLLAILAVAAVLVAAGCNDDEDESGEPAAQEAQTTGGADADGQASIRKGFVAVERQLAKVDSQVSTPPGAHEFRTSGQAPPATMDVFLTDVLGNIDRYWTRTLTSANLPEAQVNYLWLAPGVTQQTGCVKRDGSPEVANDSSAAYCPGDDTIYVAQKLASDVWNGIAEGFAGQAAGQGRAIGDFGVALILAHEYGHNVQHELGHYKNFSPATVRPFELQADCMAGAWANSVYFEGLLDEGDIEEGISTTLAVGDFDTFDPGHHGTPEQRREAMLLGYNTGDLSQCNAYLNLTQ